MFTHASILAGWKNFYLKDLPLFYLKEFLSCYLDSLPMPITGTYTTVHVQERLLKDVENLDGVKYLLFKFIYWVFREREREKKRKREREALTCSSIYLCTHRLLLMWVCALTGDWIHSLGLSGWCSHQQSYPARAEVKYFQCWDEIIQNNYWFPSICNKYNKYMYPKLFFPEMAPAHL